RRLTGKSARYRQLGAALALSDRNHTGRFPSRTFFRSFWRLLGGCWRRRLFFEHFSNRFSQLAKDFFHRLRGVGYAEVILFREPAKLRHERRLILAETLVHILCREQIHSRFPIIKSVRENHAWDQILHADAEIKDGIGPKREAVKIVHPRRINPTNQ